MSRYAAARDGERMRYPGYSTGFVAREVIPVRVLDLTYDPEFVRRHMVARVRHAAVKGYNDRRDGSLEAASFKWMKPHGRPRFRWVRRDPATLDGMTMAESLPSLLELTCVVYPEGALP